MASILTSGLNFWRNLMFLFIKLKKVEVPFSSICIISLPYRWHNVPNSSEFLIAKFLISFYPIKYFFANCAYILYFSSIPFLLIIPSLALIYNKWQNSYLNKVPILSKLWPIILRKKDVCSNEREDGFILMLSLFSINDK